MRRQLVLLYVLFMLMTHVGTSRGADPPAADSPDPVPVTRQAMHQVLDASKQAAPRLPPPPLTDEEKELIQWQQEEAKRTGEPPRRYGLANNGRTRAYYLAEYGFSLDESLKRAREGDYRPSDSSLDRSMRTMMFWIVSRGNNCTYCLGHQESGLAAQGVSDEQLAALDYDWSVFSPAHQAAFEFARKLSFEPFAIGDADFEALREHFSDQQVFDIVVTVAGFNATNRWTGPLRIQQDVLMPFEQPESATYGDAVSIIAPLGGDDSGDRGLPHARPRVALESPTQVDAALSAARARSPRFNMADPADVAALFDEPVGIITSEPWARALAAYPGGEQRITAYRAAMEAGTLTPRTKAMIAYVAARHDRAWYALGHAMERLRALGLNESQMFAFDNLDAIEAAEDRAVLEFARKIAVDPALVTDHDFASLRPWFSDKQIAEIVYVTSQAAFFNRFTEAANLPLAHDVPRPLPRTRLELKELIEDVKARTPRIPLPPLSEEDRQSLGARADSYETRLRFHYLGGDVNATPAGRGAGRRGRDETPARGGGNSLARSSDPLMTLDNAFKVELFWIVSRVNNCQYCLGHQESKLLAAGLSEDDIAALDGDWSVFEAAEREAFEFARKFTYTPHLLSDQDIESLRAHYSDSQILEMILSMAGNNAINRWKEGVGVPQRHDEGGYSRVSTAGDSEASLPDDIASLPRGTYLTPTSPRFATMITRVVPLPSDSEIGEAIENAASVRPPLETPEEVQQALQQCMARVSRLPLVDDEQVRERMPDLASNDASDINWLRLLANFPVAGRYWAERVRSAEELELSPLLRAQLAWIVARQDRAWYAVGQAYRRLQSQGQTDDQIFALDTDWSAFSPRERALFTVATHLAASPVVLTDREVDVAVELAGPRDVVQTIQYVTQLAAYNRITEAAGLPLERESP